MEMDNELNTLAKKWGWLLFFGIILDLFGTAAILAPQIAGLAIELSIGVLFILGGSFQLIHTFRNGAEGGFFVHLLLALLSLTAGIILVAYPLQGLLTLTLVLSAFLTVQGFFRLILAFQLPAHQPKGWVGFGGILSITLGILIYLQLPSAALWAIGLLVGIDFIFSGWTMIFSALSLRNLGKSSATARS